MNIILVMFGASFMFAFVMVVMTPLVMFAAIILSDEYDDSDESSICCGHGYDFLPMPHSSKHVYHGQQHLAFKSALFVGLDRESGHVHTLELVYFL